MKTYENNEPENNNINKENNAILKNIYKASHANNGLLVFIILILCIFMGLQFSYNNYIDKHKANIEEKYIMQISETYPDTTFTEIYNEESESIGYIIFNIEKYYKYGDWLKSYTNQYLIR